MSRHNGNRRPEHAFIPDIHASNFPLGRQRVNDSGSTRDAEAIFEVKAFTACKSRYAHNNTTTAPVDRQEKCVVSEYIEKFRNLDVAFAADMAGDGTNGITGQFEATQGRFYQG